MGECLCNRGLHLIGVFGGEAKQASGLCHLCEAGIFQVGGKIQNAGGLHLQLYEGQEVIPEYDDLDGRAQLPQRKQISGQHGEAAVSRHRNDLAPGVAHLRADRLGQRVRHGAVIERTGQTALAVHLQAARGPDRGRTDIARKDRVFGGQLVEHPHHVLRMDRFVIRSPRRQLVQAFPCFPVVIERSLQVPAALVLRELRQQGTESDPDVADEAVVDPGASADLLPADINLHHGCLIRKELLIWKIAPKHEQEIAVHHRVIAG